MNTEEKYNKGMDHARELLDKDNCYVIKMPSGWVGVNKEDIVDKLNMLSEKTEIAKVTQKFVYNEMFDFHMELGKACLDYEDTIDTRASTFFGLYDIVVNGVMDKPSLSYMFLLMDRLKTDIKLENSLNL